MGADSVAAASAGFEGVSWPPAWAALTLLAAFLQNARSALQKTLMGPLGGLGAAYARFLYGAPFALLLLVALYAWTALGYGSAAAPFAALAPTSGFAAGLAAGAAAQVFATVLLLRSFAAAGFAVGTAFSKTEPVMAALAGAIVFAETPAPLAMAGILVSVVGVMAASWPRGGLGRADRRTAALRAAMLGVGAAALFGVSAAGYRAATLGLGEEASAAFRAALALSLATLLQASVMGLWLRAYARDQFEAAAGFWRRAWPVGLFGAGASACWFAAFALEPVAHVRTLAQVEAAFALATAYLLFGERPSLRELAGMALMIGGVILLLAGAL